MTTIAIAVHPNGTPFNVQGDDGCSLHDRCVTCPLPVCRYEEPRGLQTVRSKIRAEAIRAAFKGNVKETAKQFGVSDVTVWRATNGAQV